MQITHEDAHKLIHFKSDKELNSNNEEALDAHLKNCAACRVYSDEIKETETILQQTMRKHWGLRPLPLRMEAIGVNVSSKRNPITLLSTRTALIGIGFVMFTFFAWQSLTTNNTTGQQIPISALPLIPTPSSQFTATDIIRENCKEIRYIVREGDTLENIALQFSSSPQAISAVNNLTSDVIRINTELIILLCGSTPTSTIYPPTYTITPRFETAATTPG